MKTRRKGARWLIIASRRSNSWRVRSSGAKEFIILAHSVSLSDSIIANLVGVFHEKVARYRRQLINQKERSLIDWREYRHRSLPFPGPGCLKVHRRTYKPGSSRAKKWPLYHP